MDAQYKFESTVLHNITQRGSVMDTITKVVGFVILTSACVMAGTYFYLTKYAGYRLVQVQEATEEERVEEAKWRAIYVLTVNTYGLVDQFNENRLRIESCFLAEQSLESADAMVRKYAEWVFNIGHECRSEGSPYTGDPADSIRQGCVRMVEVTSFHNDAELPYYRPDYETAYPEDKYRNLRDAYSLVKEIEQMFCRP